MQRSGLLNNRLFLEMFSFDISQPPREWAERFFHVQRWTEMPSGAISRR
jgi:hypothetical protein